MNENTFSLPASLRYNLQKWETFAVREDAILQNAIHLPQFYFLVQTSNLGFPAFSYYILQGWNLNCNSGQCLCFPNLLPLFCLLFLLLVQRTYCFL